MILIDGIIFALQKQGGVTVYFKSLIDYISKQKEKSTLVLNELIGQRMDVAEGSVSIHRENYRFFERYRKCRIPVAGGVFHSSYYRQPDKSGMPTVVTVHDFIYERYQNGLRQWVHTTQKNSAIRAAQAVICISESTKNDLLEFVGETPGQTIHVIHNGVSDVFQNLHLGPAVTPYVLFVGQRGGYKNFNLVLKSIAHLPDMELHCVGGGPIRSEELHGVPESLRSRIHHLGFVTDRELNILYNQAVCLVYPSSYEGFGIPVVEAMRAGCPVVSAECKAVLEIGGDALTIVAGSNPRDMAEGILKTLSSERSHLIEKGFSVAQDYSWDITHRKTLEVYRSLSA